MSYIDFFYRPRATYAIVVINILIFLIFFVSSLKSEPIDYFQCIKNNYPSCLKLKDLNNRKVSNEIAECSMRAISLNISTESCIFDTMECEKDSRVIKNCVSSQDKLFLKYGFDGTDVNFLRPYTFITSMFVHGDSSHLFWNMLFLLIVGAFVESRMKTKKFLILYFVSGITASMALALFYIALGKPVLGIGASGAISGLMGANLVLDYFRNRKEETVMIFGYFPTQGFGISLLLVFFVQQFFLSVVASDKGVGYIAHFTGFMVGVVLALWLKDKDDQVVSY